MNLREALIQQQPSLALQRAAQVEIARLDALVSGNGSTVKRETLERWSEWLSGICCDYPADQLFVENILAEMAFILRELDRQLANR